MLLKNLTVLCGLGLGAALATGCSDPPRPARYATYEVAPPPPPPQVRVVEVVQVQRPAAPGPAVPITGVAPALPNGVANGRSPNFRPGQFEGLWIMRNGNGAWHLRATTHAQRHRFQGRVRPVRGNGFTEVRPTRVEWNDRVRLDPNGEISYDFDTQGGDDGFDFRVSNDACVEYHVEVDGRSQPQLIRMGAGEYTPNTSHFIVCP